MFLVSGVAIEAEKESVINVSDRQNSSNVVVLLARFGN